MTERAHISIGLKSLTERRNLMQMVVNHESGRDATVVRGAQLMMRDLEKQMLGEQVALEIARNSQ